ncbi:MAG: hypothetical protein ABJF10_23380 [Chthoniobacter sp.]|uniref:hypothetical protein n=1 Tax=Chthoniobacter sp. TaxID=2510640 RepID=UPI0032A2378D
MPTEPDPLENLRSQLEILKNQFKLDLETEMAKAREHREQVENLKDRFKLDLDAEAAKARIHREQTEYEMKGQQTAMEKEVKEFFWKEADNHREFLEKLEKTRTTRTAVYGTISVIIIGGFIAFAGTQIKERMSVAEDVVQQEVKRAEVVVDKEVKRGEDFAKQQASDEGLKDTMLRTAVATMKRQLQTGISEQTASTVEAQLGAAKTEVARLAYGTGSRWNGQLKPLDAEDLLDRIEVLLNLYAEQLGRNELPEERREALQAIVLGILDLSQSNLEAAKDQFRRAKRYDRKFPDSYSLLHYVFTLGSVYIGNGDYSRSSEAETATEVEGLRVLGKDVWSTHPDVNRLILGWDISQLKEAIKDEKDAPAREEKRKQVKEKIQLLEKHAEAFPRASNFRTVGLLHWADGEAQDGLRFLQKARDANPAFVSAANDFLWCATHDDKMAEIGSLSNAAAFYGSLPEAFAQILEQADELDPRPAAARSPDLCDTLAHTYFVLWKTAGAEAAKVARDPQLSDPGTEPWQDREAALRKKVIDACQRHLNLTEPTTLKKSVNHPRQLIQEMLLWCATHDRAAVENASVNNARGYYSTVPVAVSRIQALTDQLHAVPPEEQSPFLCETLAHARFVLWKTKGEEVKKAPPAPEDKVWKELKDLQQKAVAACQQHLHLPEPAAGKNEDAQARNATQNMLLDLTKN